MVVVVVVWVAYMQLSKNRLVVPSVTSSFVLLPKHTTRALLSKRTRLGPPWLLFTALGPLWGHVAVDLAPDEP